MALIESIDGPNRLIYLSVDTVDTEVHPIDIYKEMRELRKTDESLRKYDVFLQAYGNVSKGSGKYTERYVVEIDGTRIIPYDANSFLTITGTIITDDGNEGIDCFDRSGLTYRVDINYIPPQVEVIVISSGSGLSTEEHDQLMQIENPPSQALDDYKVDTSDLIVTLTEQDKIDIINRIWDEEAIDHQILGSIGNFICDIKKVTVNKVTKSGDVVTIYEPDGITVWKRYDLALGGRVEV